MSAEVVKRGPDGSWVNVETCADGWQAQDRVQELNGEGGDFWVRGSNGVVFRPATGSTQPPPGSWAETARMMAQGDDSGFDWDAWKDEMKDSQFE